MTSKLRKIMPPALLSSPVWTDFAEAASAVWKDHVDDQVATMKSLQDTWHSNAATGELVNSGDLIPPTEFDYLSLALVQNELKSMGVSISTPDTFSLQQLNILYRTIGRYWRQKGTAATVQYIAAVLGISLEYSRLWTQDYVTFVEEPSLGVPPGTEIWNGGTWYPTTHIQVATSLPTLLIPYLRELLYAVCSYTVIIRIKVAPFVFDVPVHTGVGLIQTRHDYLGEAL